jgi:Predicted nucleoside-diphosphate sugar epimerases
MINLYVYGAGGLGKEVTSLIRRLNRIKPRWAIQGFLDDHIEAGTTVSGLPVLGTLHYLTALSEPSAVVLAISDPRAKRRGYDYLSALGNITFPHWWTRWPM